MEWMFITNAWTIFKKSNTIESSMHITTYIKNTPAFVIFEFSPLYNKTLQLKTTSAKKGVLFIYKTVTTNYKNRRQRHLTMKKITIIILTILTIGQTFAQTDKNGNPVFNSVSTGEKSIDNFVLISNYYTLKNNIENTQSSVFISEKPTLDQIEKASINLASDFFIMTKESKMVVMVIQLFFNLSIVSCTLLGIFTVSVFIISSINILSEFSIQYRYKYTSDISRPFCCISCGKRFK